MKNKRFFIRENAREIENVSKRKVTKILVGIRGCPLQKTSLRESHSIRCKVGCV